MADGVPRPSCPASVLDALYVPRPRRRGGGGGLGAAVGRAPGAGRDRAAPAPVGFVAVGPSGEEDARPGEAAFAALLVEPRWGRRGHGSRLLAAAVDFLREDGVTGLVAWVPDGDRASAAFFESAGWEPDGTAYSRPDGGTARETRWHVSLVES